MIDDKMDELDIIIESLVNSGDVAFGGSEELKNKVKLVIASHLHIGHYQPKTDMDAMALGRIIAYKIVESGITYSELIGCDKLSKRIILEHIFIHNYIVDVTKKLTKAGTIRKSFDLKTEYFTNAIAGEQGQRGIFKP